MVHIHAKTMFKTLSGKVAIVTGANTGMGYETALALASRKCRVIMVDKVDQQLSRKEILEESCNKNVFCEYVDLGCFDSIRKFATRVANKETKLDILVNNAGIFCMDKQLTIDCLDGVMQVNHLGPFLLTHLLLDLMRKSEEARIVFVTSIGSFFHDMRLEKLENPDYFTPHFVSGAIHYYNSKLCNMITSKVLARKLQKEKITVNSVHPGMTSTEFLVSSAKDNFFGNLKRNSTKRVLQCTTRGVKDAAALQVFLATSPTLKNITGKFFVDYQVHKEPEVLENQKFCENIWRESERLVDISTESYMIKYLL